MNLAYVKPPLTFNVSACLLVIEYAVRVILMSFVLAVGQVWAQAELACQARAHPLQARQLLPQLPRQLPALPAAVAAAPAPSLAVLLVALLEPLSLVRSLPAQREELLGSSPATKSQA